MEQNHATNNASTYVGEREIVISRLIDFPRDLVFNAWMNEEQL